MCSRWSRLSAYRNLELYDLWYEFIAAYYIANIMQLLFQMQYKAIFEAVLVFLDSFDTYANF